jgi:hypothetical protein
VVAALSGSNAAVAVLGVAGSLVQAWFVTPDDLGYFRQFGIVAGYVFFLHLGTFHALERWYPYHIGRNERGRALAMAEVAQSWILAVATVLCAVFGALAAAGFARGNWKAGLGWLCQALLTLGAFYGGLLGALYRSGHDFQNVARAQMWSAPATVLALPFFWVQPYVGLFLRGVAGPCASLWVLHRHRPVRLPWRFTWPEWRHAVREGLPRFTASYAMTTGQDALMATLILARFGRTDLGYWSFALMVVTLFLMVPQSLAAVYVPRVAETYGRTGSPAQCLALCRKPMVYGFVLACAAAAAGALAVRWLLPVVAPKYAASAGLIGLLLATVPLRMLEMPANVLGAMNWLLYLNVRAVAGTAIQVVIALVGIRLGWGVYGVAAGVLAGGIFRVLALWPAIAVARRRELRDGGSPGSAAT